MRGVNVLGKASKLGVQSVGGRPAAAARGKVQGSPPPKNDTAHLMVQLSRCKQQLKAAADGLAQRHALATATAAWQAAVAASRAKVLPTLLR